MRKKVLSVLTVLSMLLSMVPAFAMAADLSYDESAVGLYVEEDAEITESVEGLVVVTAPVNVSVKDVELSDGLVLTAEAAGANVTVAGESSVGAIVVLCEATVKVEEKAAVAAVTVAAPATVEVAGKADAVVVIETAAGAAVTVAPTATVSAVELSAPGVKAEVAGTVNTLTVAATAESAAITVAETATVAAVEVAAPNVTTEVAGKVESVTVAETATGAEIVVSGTAEITTVTDATGEVTVSGEGAEKVEVAPTQPTQPAQPTQPTQPTAPSTPSEEEPEPEEPSHTHSYTEEITKEATCSEDGVKTFTCSCGDTYTEVIPATNEHPVDEVVVTEATCTEPGKKVTKYSCACPDFEEPIPALGHNYVNGVCTRCGADDPSATKVEITETEVLNANTNMPVMVVTFTVKNVDGVAYVLCEVKVGGKTYEAKMYADELADGTDARIDVQLFNTADVTAETGEVADGDTAGDPEPATTVTYTVTVTAYTDNNAVISSATKEVKNDGTVHEHKYTEKVTKEPSCTEEGSKTLTCACGDTKTETIAKTDHAWGTADADGKVTCTVCGATKSEEKTPCADGAHTWNDGEVTVAPTCNKPGVKTFTCTKCNETKTEEIAATEHSWDDGKETKAPSCTEPGVKTFTCTECNETKTEEIAATGHNFENGTCTNAGCNEKDPSYTPDPSPTCTCVGTGETCDKGENCNADCPVCHPDSGGNNSGTSDTGNEGDGTGGSGSEGTGDTDPATLR